MNPLESQRSLNAQNIHQTVQRQPLGSQDQNRLFATPHRTRHTIPEKTGAIVSKPTTITNGTTATTRPTYLAPSNRTTTTTLNPTIANKDSTPTTYPTYNSGRTWKTSSPTKVDSTYTRPVRTVQNVVPTETPVLRKEAPVVRTQPVVARPQAPVVERKLIYVDPSTGLRMMKVCTPNGTIKELKFWIMSLVCQLTITWILKLKI